MIAEDIPMIIKMNQKCFPGIEKLDNGERIDETEITKLLSFIDTRYDCSDFKMVCILRTLYSYSHLISAETLLAMKKTTLGFKYAMEEPGADGMCYWSENHQLIFSTIEYLACNLFPDEIFTNTGVLGRVKKEKAKKQLLYWFKTRFELGFVEFHSNTYYEEDVGPLSILTDLAPDEEIKKQATILMDMIMMDLAMHNYNGYFAAASGRCYEAQRRDPNKEDVLTIMSYVFNLGPVKGKEYTTLAADLYLNKTYKVPEIIKAIAHSKEHMIIKDAMGMEIKEVSKYFGNKNDFFTTGLYYWSMEAFTNVETAALTVKMYRAWKMQTNTFLKNLKTVDNWFLRTFGLYPLVVKILNPVTAGVAIHRGNVYAIKDKDYYLSTAQFYAPRWFGDQNHTGGAVVGKDVSVFITHPGAAFFEDNSRNFSPSYWVGNGKNPYAAQDENKALYYFDITGRKGFFEKPRMQFTHVHFPKTKFDKVFIGEKELVGLVGNSLVGVKSVYPIEQKSDFDFIQNGVKTAWALVVSSLDETTFEEFKDSIVNNPVVINKNIITYMNLLMKVQKNPQLFVDLQLVNTKYDRYETPFITAPKMSESYEYNYQGHSLVLNLNKGIREEK